MLVVHKQAAVRNIPVADSVIHKASTRPEGMKLMVFRVTASRGG